MRLRPLRLCAALAAGLLVLSGSQTRAQAVPPGAPAFEVATVHPSPPLDMAKMQSQMQAGKMPRFGPQITADKAEYIYMTLQDLIVNAYAVKPYQVTGPDWLNGQRFDIVANLPEGSSKDDAPAMLQALLAERFKLTAHRVVEERPVLALIVGKGGPKLKESAAPPVPLDDDAPLKPGEMKMETPEGPARVTMGAGGGTMNMGVKGTFVQKFDPAAMALSTQGVNVTMPAFVAMLNNFSRMGGGDDRQIVDMTRLTGHYDFTLLAPLPAMRGNGPQGGGAAGGGLTASDPSGPTLADSIQTLGLKLEPRKSNVDRLIVDHVEKSPTEN
jgi:uncharacterized protein (TIGR03435 family)